MKKYIFLSALISGSLFASNDLTSTCSSTKTFNFCNNIYTELKFSNVDDQNITFRVKTGKELAKEEEEKMKAKSIYS